MTFARFTLSLSAISVLGLAACQAPLPGQTTENTRTGALVGAGLGALVGAATADNDDERLRQAAIGAALGAGAGAVVGNQLDRQEAELRAQLGSNVGLVNTGNQLIVTLPNDILFATDSAALTPTLQNDLRAVAASLNRYPNTTVNVIGHADSTGPAAYNQNLSEQRARAVANVLISAGVDPRRINVIGRGEDAPIASNQTPEGRQANRRVEIVITPR
ncbi:Outer membrane protein [Rubellimicrobium thermophilum DSM 16684]|uniref:Outer membrane protein n=1 Tax=Rubellimicrobium thermophilum DSM 16684 TaxID=1123069 RepID=S9QZ18_9RHOB|nr:OmpA family protein [Rubellimicrobium thermophilum]EPX84908.1 Outer membrane protein [Rubellimicrobium thermophilum DSM 16684]